MKQIAAVILLLGWPERPEAPAQEPGDPFAREARPLLAKYCFGCHGGAKPKADLNLESFRDEASALRARKTWKKVYDMLHSDEMPPLDKPQPTPAEREKITGWIEALLAKPSLGGKKDPGPVVLRRLNRIEYNNTVADLFRLALPGGYNNYFDPRKGMPESIRVVLHRHTRQVLVDLPPDDIAHGYNTIGEALSLPPFLLERYLLAAAQVVEKASGSIRNMLRQAAGGSDRERARAFLASLAARAFRRPAAPPELDRLLALYDQAAREGEPLESAVKVPVQAILVSPDFLFKLEKDGPQDDPRGVRPLNDYELATRLSYFLWSSMPDEELFRLAAEGKLRDPAVLEAQARRMLRSPKAKELSENFAVQWLQLEALEAIMPDPAIFKEFYRRYQPKAMRLEAVFFFETILVEDRSVLEFIDADFTWANGDLAQSYGVAGAARERDSSLFWKRIPLPDKRRGGVLTMPGVLAVTSYSTRTSPVKRGKWVLEVILGAPPPPPLPDAGTLPDEPTAADGMALRKKLELHRTNPRCASCHSRIDPIGFALENYNAVGAWRDKDGSAPVDATGTLPDGTTFKGPEELKRVILTRKRDDFLRSLAGHLLTYALGRPADHYDALSIKEIVEATARDGHKLSRLVVEVVKSYPFRHRRNREVADE